MEKGANQLMTQLKLDKTYKWQEIVSTYPDLWVIVTDIKEQDGAIQSCKLLDVCTADERATHISKYIGSGIKTRLVRTTFSAPNVGILS